MPVDIPFLEENLTDTEKLLLQGVGLGTATDGPEEKCPYLHDRSTRMILAKSADLDAVRYEKLALYGWRRCGNICYRNTCPDCRECVPLRIRVSDFKPDRTQRRCLKRNTDLHVMRSPIGPSREDYELYGRYVKMRHEKEDSEITYESYQDFLTNSSFNGFILRYRLNGQLIGCAWCDLLPDSISAIYTAFDPDFSMRSPGVFSILRQIQFCRMTGKHYLQLGFYIKDCRKMKYKIGYSATEYSDLTNHWHPTGK